MRHLPSGSLLLLIHPQGSGYKYQTVSLIASNKLSPTELVESLLQLSPAQLNEEPFGPLLLIFRVPSDDDSGQFKEKLTACALRDAPPKSDSQRWPVTSQFPTLPIGEQKVKESDLVELLAELASAPHCILPLRATSPSRRFLLGRGHQCDVPLSDPSISAEHAELIMDDGGVRLTDVESKNGTYLNDHRINSDEKPWLQPMDRLTFGRVHAFTCDVRVLRGVLRQEFRSLI